MPYEIIIKKTHEVPTVERGRYDVVDKRPWTEKELADEHRYIYAGDRQAFLKSNPLKEIMDYRPDVPGTRKVETEVLKQTVDELDLAAVIKAINNL